MRLNIHETARVLSVPEQTIYRWVREGAIPFTKVNEQLRFNRADILEWATARGMPVGVDIFPEVHEAGAAPSFAAALESGGVHHDVPGLDRDAVLRAVVDVMSFPEGVDRDAVYEAMRASEALGSTGIGDGIALPHVRRPVVACVGSATIALCFLAHPVDFGAIDGLPVTTVFSLVTPTSRVHLQLLSQLSAALHDARFREAVQARAPDERILSEARRVEQGFAPGHAPR